MTLTCWGQPRRPAQGHLTDAEVFPGEAVLNQKAPENTSGYSALTFKTPFQQSPVSQSGLINLKGYNFMLFSRKYSEWHHRLKIGGCDLEGGPKTAMSPWQPQVWGGSVLARSPQMAAPMPGLRGEGCPRDELQQPCHIRKLGDKCWVCKRTGPSRLAAHLTPTRPCLQSISKSLGGRPG